MTSLLNLDRYTPPAEPTAALAPEPAPATTAESAEFEIVLGHRQIASTSLVAIVLLAVFSCFSYLIGKSMAPKAAAAVQAPPAVQSPAPAAPVIEPIAVPFDPEQAKTITTPLVGQAESGKVYLQVGAIEKGLGVIWAEGLRTNGLDAFISPGPDDKEWRVLIGPLPDPQAYQRAKDTLDKLGINTFGRRYTQ